MKKIIIAALLFLLLLVGCSDTVPTVTRYDSLIEKTKSEVAKSLETSESSWEEVDKYTFALPYSESYLNNEYTVLLQFDQSDKMYGYRYCKKFGKNAADAVKAAEDVIMEFSDKLGDPDTYPGKENRFTEAKDPVQTLESGISSSLIESWDINKDRGIIQEVIVGNLDNEITLTLVHQIRMVPTP